MSFIKKSISTLGLFTLLTPILFSCGQKGDYIYLKVLNSEDYIYKKESNDDPEDLTVQFEKYYAKKYPDKKKVKVIYDTFDTMENMFNTLQTGKTKYDLICASEYMVQKMSKMSSYNLLKPLDFDKIPNYKQYASNFIRNKFKEIKYKDDSGKELIMDNYGLCYMWGTLGIIYNPTYDVFQSKKYSKEEVINDMDTYNSLWGDTNNGKYKKTIAIKDSMRDTYAIGLIHRYQDEFNELHDKYAKKEITKDEYSTKLNEIFNRGGEDDKDASKHINEVKDDLLKLRNNIFGFEVDSGKEDIVTGKIGIDIAWSGDAVKSINDADEKSEKSGQKIELYYSLPKEGANLWFDCWCMQPNDHEDVAYEFLNFISDPENAIQNMDYIGYTSSIASDETFEYFKETYEAKEGEESTPYDLNYYFKNDSNINEDFIINVRKSDLKRQVHAQFPPADYQDKLMVMKDYGANNDLILKMWEQVKHEALPTWAIVLFVIEIVVILGGVTFIIVKKQKDKHLRKLRKEEKVGTSK